MIESGMWGWFAMRGMNSSELKGRTMDFAVRVLRLADSLPQTVSGQTLARQVARSGTSVAANYRSALRGKSRADFANKITIVLEEADETDFWIELAERAGVVEAKKVLGLRTEAEELVKIFAATRRTARSEKS
jgi:four helix bundle protein